jgi:rod shape-determining protein MreC
MQKKNSFIPYFFVFSILSLAVIFLASKTPIFSPVNSILQAVFSPVQSLSNTLFSKISGVEDSKELNKLKQENIALSKKIIDQQKLIEDNKALRDQFETENPRSINLLPADVIAAPGFIPGVSVPETIIINRGGRDGVRKDYAVVYQDNLIGKVNKVYDFSSSIMLLTNSSSSFTVKTLKSNSLGVLKGQGGGAMILNNVLLSEKLQKDDFVLTKGEEKGFPPNLIVGKISSISKIPSDLFQKAEVKSLLDFNKMEKVFVVLNR